MEIANLKKSWYSKQNQTSNLDQMLIDKNQK